MLNALLASDWVSPSVDYHALAPEIVLGGGILLLLLLDLFLSDAKKWVLTPVASFTLLGAFIPVLTVALDTDGARSLFDGRYVVDDFSLVLKALFLLAGYVVVLLSADHIREGNYYQGEYWFLMLSSILGMVMMASSRDLVSIFVSLEFLSIPAYMLAAWRKRDPKSNEAGIKYYLLGVFASAVMLYGMSLLYGAANTTLLVDLGKSVTNDAEWVWEQVHAMYPSRRLIYRDTMGRWDEIVPTLPTDHFGEVTVNFRPYGEHLPF